MPMLHRPYGSTGVEVSALGFGGMRFEDIDDTDACVQLVRACYDAGITYFDTAPGYFQGKSEKVMGLAFQDMLKTRAERPFHVSTKTFADTPEALRAECERSLARLKVPAIDFYHMWCVLSREGYLARTAQNVLREFEKLKEEGLVRHLCISTHMPGDEVAWVLERYPFEGVLLGYSAMNFGFRETGVEAAAKLGRGVVVMNPLAGGAIPQNPEKFAYLRTRPEEGETVVEGALRFLFNDPRLTVTLVGMQNRAHLAEAVSAMEGYRPLPPAEVARLRGGLESGLNALCTGCGYCDRCPQGLPLPKHMDAYNQYLLTGKEESMGQRLTYHWQLLKEGHKLDACTECGACEAVCTQKLPIIERLKAVDAARRKQLAMSN